MTRVQVYFEGKEKYQWGYFDGVNFTISNVQYTPLALMQENGVIRTTNKPLLEKLRALGYKADSLEEAKYRWRKNNLQKIDTLVPNSEKAAFKKYCEEHNVSMHSLLRSFIRKTIGLE